MTFRAQGRPAGPCRSAVQTSASTCSVFLCRQQKGGFHDLASSGSGADSIPLPSVRSPVAYPRPMSSARMAPRRARSRSPMAHSHRKRTPCRWCGRRCLHRNQVSKFEGRTDQALTAALTKNLASRQRKASGVGSDAECPGLGPGVPAQVRVHDDRRHRPGARLQACAPLLLQRNLPSSTFCQQIGNTVNATGMMLVLAALA